MEDITDVLRRQVREMHINDQEFDGWADRIMHSILTPLGDDRYLMYKPSRTKGSSSYKAER